MNKNKKIVSSILNACMKNEETIKAFPSQIFQKTKHSWTEHQSRN